MPRWSLANLRSQVLLAVLLGVLPAMGVAVATSLKQRSATEEEIRLDLHRLALAARSHHRYHLQAAHQPRGPLPGAPEGDHVEFDGFDDLIQSARLLGQVSLTVVDANGIVMFRYPPSTARPGDGLPERFLLPAIRSHQDQTIEHADPALGQVMYSVAPLDRSMGHDSSLILALPTTASLAVADRWLAAELAAMALAGILSLVVATTALYRFTLHPLGRLLETTARLGTGDLSARTGLSGARGEVGLLAYAVDGMAASLQDRDDKLRHAEIRVRALLEQSIAGVYVIDDERLLYVNEAFARIFGRTAQDLVGHG